MTNGYITARVPGGMWNYDMTACRTGAKCLLLTIGAVLVVGSVTEETRKYYAAWAPMPKRDKAEEERRGIHI